MGLWGSEYTAWFDRPGIVAAAPSPEPEGVICIGREQILSLLLKKDGFFNTCPEFLPMKNATDKARAELQRQGVLDGNAEAVKGCSNCGARAVLYIVMQLLFHAQTVFVLSHREGKTQRLGDNLRAFLGTDKPIAVYLRNANNKVEEIKY